LQELPSRENTLLSTNQMSMTLLLHLLSE
jgi:hypothetical protein